MKRNLILALVIGFFFYQSGVLNRFFVPTATAEDIKAEIAQNSAVLVDVRENSEIQETGSIQGAFIIPLSEINSGSAKNKIETLPKDKKIFLYCRSGNRSATAGKILKNLGYQVSNAGAFNDLIRLGFQAKKP